MIFSCENCKKSFRTKDEGQKQLILKKYIVRKPELNLADYEKLPLSESEKTQLIETHLKILNEQQIKNLEMETPRSTHENVVVVDKDGVRYLVIYQDLFQVTEAIRDDQVIYSCPQCSAEFLRMKI